jgi:hypothetical protein
MKLPTFSAERALGPSIGTYLSHRPGSGTIRPSGSVVTAAATTACLSSCVGPSTAALCSARCGDDLSCWQTCAGIADTSCVASCLRG